MPSISFSQIDVDFIVGAQNTWANSNRKDISIDSDQYVVLGLRLKKKTPNKNRLNAEFQYSSKGWNQEADNSLNAISFRGDYLDVMSTYGYNAFDIG